MTGVPNTANVSHKNYNFTIEFRCYYTFEFDVRGNLTIN